MKKLLFTYIATVIIGSLVITGVVSFLINKGLRRSSIDFYGKINHVIDSTANINVLLVGSSRVLAHIDPVIIDSFTHLKSYNAGLNGATIKTCYNIIAASVKNQPDLSYIVLNIDFNMFKPDVDPYKDAYYYPFEKSSDTFVLTRQTNSYIIHKMKFLDIATYDDYAKYAAIRGLLSKSGNTENGFFPHLEPGFTVPDKTMTASHKEIYKDKGFILLKKIMEICKQKKIGLTLVVAPYEHQYSPELYIENYKEILDSTKLLSKEYGVSLFDYTHASFASDTSFFYNSYHLNLKGARAYSLQLAHDLQQCLIKKNDGMENIHN